MRETRLNTIIVLVYLLALVAWQLASSVFSIPAFILPSPLSILERAARSPGALAFHTLVTLQEVLLGFLLAVLISVPLGMLIVSSRLLERLVYPLLVAFQAIPKVALAPILVIWFGFGLTSKVSLAFVPAMFPIVINTVVGITQAMVGAVVGEFIAADRGLGYSLLIANSAFDMPLLFGNVILLSALSVGLFYLIELIEVLVLPRPLRRKAMSIEPGA